MIHNLTDNEFISVSKIVTKRMGLDFPPEKRGMLDHSLSLAADEFGYQDVKHFIKWILTDNFTKDQIKILASFLTINETYFWREPNVFNALTDSIFPDLVNSLPTGEKSIRIWSAGCSSGEEAYSIAIALHRTLKNIDDWNISILATDIDPQVIAKASKGVYGPWSFRDTPAWFKKSYFNQIRDNKYEIIPEIKKLVSFECRSLVEAPTVTEKSMDIIFCRNVLMYFSDKWVNEISNNFFNALSNNGWFVVSSCELSDRVFTNFTTVNFPGAVLYRKEISATKYSFNDHFKGVEPKFNEENIPSLNFDDEVIKQLFIENFKPESKASDSIAVSDNSTESGIPANITADALAEKENTIRLLAGTGNLKDALSACNELIAENRLGHRIYLLRGSILQEMNEISEAITTLRKAIYIDPEFIMGHFTLGNLFLKTGNDRSATRYFNNVIDLTDSLSNDYILPESEGLSIEYIREIIFSTMQTQNS